MKYIRTKFGRIYEIQEANLPKHSGNNFVIASSGKVLSFGEDSAPLNEFLFKDDIVGEADTIEELFDCYADYCEAYNFDIIYPKKPIRRKNHEIYGAVWINDNLKYIAKMNEEGEFELL